MSTSTPSDRGAGADQTRTDQPPVRDTATHPAPTTPTPVTRS